MPAPMAGLPPWSAPEPRQLPDWRTRLLESTTSEEGLLALATAINAGQSSITPIVAGHGHSVGAVGAQLLARLEAARLKDAALYYATADMTALAVAAGSTAPMEPVRESRPPAARGLMLFQAPIGGYDTRLAELLDGSGFTPVDDVTVTTPIVAVSWSPWTPNDITVDGAPGRVRWRTFGPAGLREIPPAFAGIWLTFYAPGGSAFAALPPSTVVAIAPDGSAITARHVAQDRHGAQLQWDNEMLLAFGARFDPDPPPDTTAQWAQIVYTAWQLIGQVGGKSPLAEIEDVPRDRAGAKRAVRWRRRRPARRPPWAGGARSARARSALRPG